MSLRKFPNRRSPEKEEAVAELMLPIVIVDDSREDAMLAIRVLKECKIVNPIIVLKSGEECIDFFEGKGEHGNRSLPCLLFLDLAMNPIRGGCSSEIKETV